MSAMASLYSPAYIFKSTNQFSIHSIFIMFSREKKKNAF